MSQIPPPVKGPLKTPASMRTTAASPVVAVAWNDPSQRTPLMLLGGLIALLTVAYWDMFTLTSAAWSEDLYSHGWIVPVFAIALLWLRWEPFTPAPNSERWIGLALLALGLSLRLFAAEYALNPVDRISFIPSIFGAFMLVGGFRTIRWAWPARSFSSSCFRCRPHSKSTC